VVHAFGGVIERYIGDSVMAVFGAPVAHGDDALRSVRAALAIQAEVLPALSLQFGRTLQASIGICFGQVMFTQGEAGHPEGLAVVGEAVNLAARVQG
jgi:class 3 adenylate cyclase